MRTLIFETEQWEKEHFQKYMKGYNMSCFDDTLTIDNAGKAAGAEVIAVFIHSKMDEKMLAKLPKLKCIITRSVGFDHIDLKACKERKISVFNIPDYGTATVAEHTFALMLALTRKVNEGSSKTKQGKFNIQGLEGVDISGKTLGVIGAGRIGQAVIKIAKSFGMNIIVYDLMKDKKLEKGIGFTYVPLSKLFELSDIVTLHAPLTEQTKHIVNEKTLSKMKKGAFIVNTARGPLIDTKALLVALDSGQIAGAAVDVIEGEQEVHEEHELLRSDRINKENAISLVFAHELMQHERAIVTPHIAFYTAEALERIVQKTCSIIKRFEKGDSSGSLT
jgi:D-lactate dehydrogenase